MTQPDRRSARADNHPTKGELTRQRILEVAARLFWTRSFQGVNTSEIADAALVNKATLYRHFPSKDDLILAVIQRNLEWTEAFVFAGSFARHTDPKKRLREIYTRVHNTQAEMARQGACPGCPFVNLATELATENSAVREAVLAVQSRFSPYYKDIVKAAHVNSNTPNLSISTRSQALINLMNGALVAAKYTNDPNEIMKALPTAYYLAGLT